MSDIAKAGVTQLIDIVDVTTEKAVHALGSLETAAADTATGVVKVGDTTAKAALAEVQALQTRLVSLLREIADGVTEPLP